MSERQRPTFDWTLFLAWILTSTLGWVLAWAFLGDLSVGAVVGALQWLVLRRRMPQAGWWGLLSAAGWLAGLAIVALLLPPQAGILAGPILGAGIGIGQWLFLRRHLRRAGWWIVTSTLGWTAGLMGILGISMVGTVAGATTGYTLELLLRYARLRAKPCPES